MCFSASASFAAGVVLSAIGVATIKQTRTPSQIAFASIPLIFGIQQITEGFLWVSLLRPEYASLQQVTTYNFLFFAQVVWPFWVPFAILKLEPREKRRTAEKILVGVGVLVSVYLAWCLVTFPVEGKILGRHIVYEQNYPDTISRYCGFLYIVATILPPFLARNRRMWILGTTILISYLISTVFYTDYLVSVWCYFASVISIAVFVIIYDINKPDKALAALSKENA